MHESTMITVENISKSYGAQTLFENVSFRVNPRERVGLVGRNGHGKTTKIKRRLRKGAYADSTNEATIKRMIPYK